MKVFDLSIVSPNWNQIAFCRMSPNECQKNDDHPERQILKNVYRHNGKTFIEMYKSIEINVIKNTSSNRE